MIKDWLEEKNFKVCKKCGNRKFYSKLSKGKIERYALYCSGCNKFIAWIPNIYIEESKIIEDGMRLFTHDNVIDEVLGL